VLSSTENLARVLRPDESMNPDSLSREPTLEDAVHATGEEATPSRLEQLEAAYQAAQAQLMHYRELFEFAPDAYLVTDRSGIIEEANRATSLLLQTSRTFLVGKPLLFFIDERDRQNFYTRLNRLLHSGEPFWECELRLRSRSAGSVHVALTVAPVFGPDDQLRGLRWLLRDVSARYQAEGALRAEKTFTDDLIESARVFVLVLDAEGQPLRVNRFLEQTTGHARQRLLGPGGWEVLFPGPEGARLRSAFLRPLDEGATIQLSHSLADCEGRPRAVVWSAQALANELGDEANVLVVGHDVTELQEAQRKALQLERLAAIGQMAAGLAHESRNALQRSQSCLELLRWQLTDQPAVLDLVEGAQKAQEDLLQLYEAVRDYAAPFHLRPRRCSLAEVWREAWADVFALSPQRDAALHEETGDLDLFCIADPFFLKGAFRNVLENSLAVCPDSVRITISCSAAEWSSQPALRVAVRDNGPGFNAEQRQHLFEPFYTTKLKGTGLGLALVRRVVEAHGGHVAAGEGPLAGAEIVFTLPRSQP